MTAVATVVRLIISGFDKTLNPGTVDLLLVPSKNNREKQKML